MLLELNNISKSYESPSGKESRIVLDNLSLRVAQGESLAIVGPSGSGKSTLLNIVGSLDKPSTGEVIFKGQNLADLSEIQLARFRNKNLGFVFQLHHLLPQCTVLENVLIPTLAFPDSDAQSKRYARAKDLLDKVGLITHLDHRPAQLSGGEQQRVAVVRALINRPELILADEPTGSLDQNSAENLGELLISLRKTEGITLIVVTHSSKLAGHMEKIYNLREGRLELESR